MFFASKKGFWIVAVIVFTAIVGLIDLVKTGNGFTPVNDSELVCISDSEFYDQVIDNAENCCVLFTMNNSPYCDEMEYKLNQLKADKYKDLPIYKLDVTDCPDLYYRENVSGTPLIVLYREGKEAARVMGSVSTFNLDLILKRKMR
ncbi:thioredoxin family protein [Bacteroides sp. OttesenSCG-928-J23]|nr:thioredoxin family protein [Bacteroides sp. OttesenSCG-928-J23]MDL2299606.1 thioredoxin family protein [Bacteroides sp. OttesenSCG-928-E20]